jgi:hypothetical protein
MVIVGGSGGLPTPSPIAIVHPKDADPFVLAAAFVGVGALYATADPCCLCVFERYAEAVLIDTRHPDVQRELTVYPVGVFAALDEQLLLVHGETSVLAVGIDGVKWESADLFTDDLHIRRTDNGRIVCRGWNYNVSSTAPVEVTLDARTGKVIA